MNKKLVRKLKTEPAKFAHLLGFNLLTDIHNEWIRKMVWEEDNDYTLLAHRGSYKTTCLSIAFAMLIVLKPGKSIFFIRKTDDDVIEIIEQTRKILTSDVFVYIVRQLYDVDLELTTSSAFKIDTNLNESTRGQVQLQGMGLNGSITGKHSDLVFTDDIVNLKDRVSRAEREQTKRQYQELQNIKNRGGRIFNTGTPWHKKDCISTLMPNVHKFDVYSTGLISQQQQQALKSSMSASLYAANYELKHIADKDAMFKNVNWLEKSAENTALIFNGVAHVDASYDGSDYTAYTVMKELKGGRIIAFGMLKQEHVDSCIQDMKLHHERLQAGTIALETNADKGYLADELEDNGFITYTYHESTNKFVKIATYLKKNWEHIWWLAETDADYINMICDYNENAEHDDAPDSAASLLRYMLDAPKANTAAYLHGGI